MEQRQMRLVNLIEFWTFIPLFLFFKAFNQSTKMISSQGTEGLVLKTDQDGLCMGNRGSDTNRCEFLPKEIALSFRQFRLC